jgi:hypothetical protein
MEVINISMTEMEKLQEITKFIRGLKLSVKIIQKASRKSSPDGWFDESSIVVYCTNVGTQTSEVASILLHEFGHYIATHKVGLRNHTERDAWAIAEKTVPSDLKPINFNKTKLDCLNSYKKAGLGNL